MVRRRNRPPRVLLLAWDSCCCCWWWCLACSRGREVPLTAVFSPPPGCRVSNPPRFRILMQPGNTNGVAPTTENLQRFMRTLLGLVTDHQDAWPFVEPVDAAEVPDYYEVIKNPMSLALIQQRLQSQQYYVTLEMFAADFRIMFSNARKYNAQDTEYYKCANRLVRVGKCLRPITAVPSSSLRETGIRGCVFKLSW